MASKWITKSYEGLLDLPAQPGCYVFIGDGKVVYIGSTVNLKSRIGQYSIQCRLPSSLLYTPWGNFANFVLKIRLSRKLGDWLMVEFRLIQRLKPSFNFLGLKRKKPKEPNIA